MCNTRNYQVNPHGRCRNRLPTGGICKNPRCSLECRKEWGRQQVWFMLRRLDQIPHFFIYFATFKVYGAIEIADYARIKSKFTTSIRQLNKKSGSTIEYRAITEMGYVNPDIHFHLCFYNNLPIAEDTIKTLWSKSCGDFESSSVFGEAWHSQKAAVKYMFKYEQKRKKFIRLFNKGTFPLTWQSRRFFGVKFQRFKRETYDEWHKKRKITSVRLPPFPCNDDLVNNFTNQISIKPVSTSFDDVLNADGSLFQNHKLINSNRFIGIFPVNSIQLHDKYVDSFTESSNYEKII